MTTLYHYPHCPYCVRVRLALGFLKIPYKSKILAYDDEKTPLSMIGKKMLPIIQTEEMKYIPESLDIISLYDKSGLLSQNSLHARIDQLLTRIGKDVHKLAMPYWIHTPEFNETSKTYFQKKKEISKGPFKELYYNREKFLDSLQSTLSDIESRLEPYYFNDKFTLNDILIASHLWGLYIVPEFQFSNKLHNYLQKIKQECNFEYHEGCWE